MTTKRNIEFTNYLVIGTGTVALKVLGILRNNGLEPQFILSRDEGKESVKAFCDRNEIKWSLLQGKEITKFLGEINDSTLVVSASNRYLFPKSVILNPNLYIINYHAALLPDFPGRNAEAWCIYNRREVGGITWHEVLPEVDAGMILGQEEVAVDSKMTSLKLLMLYSKMAIKSFDKILSNVMTGEWTVREQNQSTERQLYYSWQRPSEGVLNAEMETAEMSALLRCYDYGPLEVLGELSFHWNGDNWLIKEYSIKNSTESFGMKQADSSGWVQIAKDGLEISLRTESIVE